MVHVKYPALASHVPAAASGASRVPVGKSVALSTRANSLTQSLFGHFFQPFPGLACLLLFLC